MDGRDPSGLWGAGVRVASHSAVMAAVRWCQAARWGSASVSVVACGRRRPALLCFVRRAASAAPRQLCRTGGAAEGAAVAATRAARAAEWRLGCTWVPVSGDTPRGPRSIEPRYSTPEIDTPY